MADVPNYPVADDQYLAFGMIVQQFARFERLIEIVINGALGARHFGVTALAISGLMYSAKCDALESLLKVITFPGTQNGDILRFVKKFNEFSSLRNMIAHRAWIPGTRPGSIKPLSITARGGKAKISGLHEEEPDYLVDDLFRIAYQLDVIRESFRLFLVDVGAMPDAADIAAKMAETNAGSNKFPDAPSK